MTDLLLHVSQYLTSPSGVRQQFKICVYHGSLKSDDSFLLVLYDVIMTSTGADLD